MALLDEQASGVHVTSATPFSDTGALDRPSTGRLVNCHLERAVVETTVPGIMGEAPKLPAEEAEGSVACNVHRIGGRAAATGGVNHPGLSLLGDLTFISLGSDAHAELTPNLTRVERATLRLDENVPPARPHGTVAYRPHERYD